jgi:hypothetical protein
MNFGDLDLNTTWFVLVGVLFTGYAMLDGFDLGVGALHLFTKKDEDRRIMLNAIGPVWDGNEVWLVTAAARCSPLSERLCHGVLRFLPRVHAAAGGADLPGGGHRVPQQASRCAGGGRCGTWASPAAACAVQLPHRRGDGQHRLGRAH